VLTTVVGMRTTFIVLAVVAFWLAMLPPFFTHGECGAEFAAATAMMHAARPSLATLEQAQAYLSAKALPFEVVSAERCESWPGIDVCAGGPVILVSLPVQNRICRIYRDSATHVQLGFNSLQQLTRTQTDMKPEHLLKVPLLGSELAWGK
jgi:hypothetical protein